MIKSFKLNKILSIIILLFLLVFITNPKTYMNATLNGLSVWFYNVLPALLPFFITTRILIYLSVEDIKYLDKVTNKMFKVNGGGKIFFLSIISGYPIGAKLICEAYRQNKIKQNDAKKMLSYCSVSGPMFIIGSVGIGVFKSLKIGYILLISHIIGAIINGLIFRNSNKTNEDSNNLKYFNTSSNSNILADSMLDSITSILLVGGYIVFSFVLIELLNNLQIIPSLAYLISKSFNLTNINTVTSFLNGCVEMTGGIICLEKQNLSSYINISISSFLIAFGGLSIFLQSLNFTKDLKIKKSYFLLIKLSQGIITLIVSLILSVIIF